MEYPKIISLVPEGEHFDASAVNEGVWLSVEHMNAIESRLTENETGAALMLNAANDAGQQIASLNDQLNAAKQTIGERDATIETKDAEIAALKAGPAAAPQNTVKEKDDLNDNNKIFESEVTKEANRLRAIRDAKY